MFKFKNFVVGKVIRLENFVSSTDGNFGLRIGVLLDPVSSTLTTATTTTGTTATTVTGTTTTTTTIDPQIIVMQKKMNENEAFIAGQVFKLQ